MPSIAISVKTNIRDPIGTLCIIEDYHSFSAVPMDAVYEKIQEDLDLDKPVTQLVRLMPNGKTMHSVVQKPSLLSETDCYLAKVQDHTVAGKINDNEDDDQEPSSEDESIESDNDQRKYGNSYDDGNITSHHASAFVPQVVTPSGKKKKKRRPKAVAAVAAATAAVLRNSQKVNGKRKLKTSRSNKRKMIKRWDATDSSSGNEEEAEFEKETKPKRTRFLSSKDALTEEQRREMANVPIDLEDFERYLWEEEEIRPGNVKLVTRQVRLLADGEGITYRNWKNGVVFKPNYVLQDIGEDFDTLRTESILFEQKHGRDKGNGWLMRHPIRKLENYQKYYYYKFIAPNHNNEHPEEITDPYTASNDNDLIF